MINLIMVVVCLGLGGFFLTKFFGSSPSLKNKDEHNKNRPMDDSIVPPNSQNGTGGF